MEGLFPWCLVEPEQFAFYQQQEMKNTLSNKKNVFSGTNKNRCVFHLDDSAHLVVVNGFCNSVISHRGQRVVSTHRQPLTVIFLSKNRGSEGKFLFDQFWIM